MQFAPEEFPPMLHTICIAGKFVLQMGMEQWSSYQLTSHPTCKSSRTTDAISYRVSNENSSMAEDYYTAANNFLTNYLEEISDFVTVNGDVPINGRFSLVIYVAPN